MTRINTENQKTMQSRLQSGMCGVGYTLLAATSAFIAFDAFRSEKCGLNVLGKIVVPYCRGGAAPTTIIAFALPVTAIASAKLAKQYFQECFAIR